MFSFFGLLIFDVFISMMCEVFMSHPSQKWLDKKQVRNLIRYCKEMPQQEGEFLVLASKEKEKTWFHLSQKNNNTESRLMSFFRNHAQWLELESYKVIVPISEVEIESMYIRKPELSVCIVGPLKVRAKVETKFNWHNDRLHLGFALRNYHLYIINIILNLRFLFGFWKPDKHKEYA
ncbi:hypothetical protein [Paenibacillus sp. RC343]|uniref:hypothetical protein n=1 Tax=Paenibacillus sp. RC343 TaxID=3045841 RepID=UPI0024BA0237|nr:hypothetical protein [Paenibacillus sp. RC343]